MNKFINLLREIQALDSKIIKENKLIEQIPQKISEFEKPLKDIKLEFEKINKEQEIAVKKRREREADLDEIIDKIKKMKSRVNEIKTNKEYQAYLKEIEKAEELKNSTEDEILIAMDKVDEKDKFLKKLKEKLKLEDDRVNKNRVVLNKEQGSAKVELEHLLVRRNELSKSINGDIYNQYMGFFESKNALAVVRVKDEICLGCNMSIPPQTYAEVMKSDQLIKCPQCGRFLFYEDESINTK